MAGGGGGESYSTASPMAAQFDTFLKRKPFAEEANFDITAMIDLVFMMNIFFLVTSLTASMAEVDLPPARFCTAADEKEAVVVIITSGNDPDSPVVGVVGEGPAEGTPDTSQQEELVRTAVEKGIRENRKKVLIKAEKKILVRHIVRISSLAASVEGAEPLFAVMELDTEE